MDFHSVSPSSSMVTECGDGFPEKGDQPEKDHSPAAPKPSEPQHPEKLQKNSSGSGSTDDFEHVGGDGLLDDFLGATQVQLDSLKSDVGNEFAQMKSATKDLSSDFMAAFDDKISTTRDFMAAERQGFAAPPVSQPARQPEPFIPASALIKEPTAPAHEPAAAVPSAIETMDFFNSPVKKIAKEDNEKFISSEDLLGDFKDERRTPEPALPAPIKHEPVAPVPIIPTPAPVIAAPAVPAPIIPPRKEELQKLPEPEAPKPVTKLEEKPTAPPPSKPVESTKPASAAQKKTSKPMISAEEMFCRFGLVESLIYWRDVKKSGIVFGAELVILLAISCFSVISVFAYLSLLTLVGTVAFRIYKNVLGAIQKTSEGHPFKDYLEFDLTISQEKAQNVVTVVVAHFNGFVSELRRLFLVDDLVDSIKFGVILWVLTYIGAWFNGMTLVILAFVALFTLPKVYENNKQSIDTYLDLVRSKILEITDKVKAAIPIGKKQETEKDK